MLSFQLKLHRLYLLLYIASLMAEARLLSYFIVDVEFSQIPLMSYLSIIDEIVDSVIMNIF